MNPFTNLNNLPNLMQPKISQGMDLKETRDNFKIELRKTNNEHTFNQKRTKLFQPQEEKKENQFPANTIDKSYQTLDFFRQLAEHIKYAYTENDFINLEMYIIKLRKELSLDDSPPTNLVIKTEVHKLLLHLLEPQYIGFINLQVEVGWILSNLAVGDDEVTGELMVNGADDKFLQMLESTELILNEQALWGIGNLISESSIIRDIFLKKKIVQLLENVAQKPNINHQFLEVFIWCVSNIFKTSPGPELPEVIGLLSCINDFIQTNNENILCDSMWALYYFLEDKTDEDIEEVINFDNVLKKTIESANVGSIKLKVPAIKLLGIIASSEIPAHVDEILKFQNIVQILNKNMNQNECKLLKRDTIWATSNILAGSILHISSLLGDQLILCTLIKEMVSPDVDFKREAFTAMRNLFAQISDQITYEILDTFPEIIDHTMQVLTVTERKKIIILALEILQSIIMTGSKKEETLNYNPYKVMIEQKNGIQIIDNLQQKHPDEEVREKISQFIDQALT